MKRVLKASFLLACVSVMLVGCNCYKSMTKKANTIQTSSSPSVLVLKGSNIAADVTVTFPAKYFDEMAILKITPVLVFNGGEIVGTPKFVQGEKVKDNYTVIAYKTGGSYTQAVTFPYDARAMKSTLELRIESKCQNGCKKSTKNLLPTSTIVVAQGVSAIQNLADYSNGLVTMADNYKRVTTTTQDAAILFQVNKADVRKEQLTTSQIKTLQDFVNANSSNIGTVYSKGYASPEGPVKLNDELSKKRSEAGKNAAKQTLGTSVKYDAAAYGEDWDGFKQLVQASNIQDKDLILKVLEMYSSPIQREQEVRNMSSVFTVLKNEILPQLRRAQIVANAELPGSNDAALKKAVVSDLNSLDVEKALYAATLLDNNSQKATAYGAIATKWNDARAYNNQGVALAKEGKNAEAQRAFANAAKLSSSSQVSNNMGILALMQGDMAEANKYLASGGVAESRGLVALANGNYNDATKSLSGYNLAVAEVANGNLAKAKTALGNDKSADADYLRAIISMRENDAKAAQANLKSSIAKNPAMEARAKADVEFVKLYL